MGGVSNSQRPNIKSLTPNKLNNLNNTQKMKVFISYRRTDSKDIVGRIYDRLIEKFGSQSVFKDVNTIPLGSDFRQVIDEAVKNCHVQLVVIGREWLTVTESDGSRRLDNPRDYVRLEIESALERRIPVIPVWVRGAKMPSAQDLPLAIRNLAYCNGINVRSDPDFHPDMDRLIKAIESLMPNIEVYPPSLEESNTMSLPNFKEDEKKRILKDIEIYQKQYDGLTEDIDAVVANLDTADNYLTRKRLKAQIIQLEEERQPVEEKLKKLKEKLAALD